MGMLVLVQTNQGLTVNFAYIPIEPPYCSYSWFYHRVPVISTKSPFNPIKSLKRKKTPFSSGLEPPVARHHFQGLWYCGGASGSSTGSVECSSVAGVQPGTVADAQRTVAPLWMTVGMMMGLQLVEWEN